MWPQKHKIGKLNIFLSKFPISWMYRYHFYDLKVHFWWPNKHFIWGRSSWKTLYYDKTYRLSKHNGVEVFIKSGLNFHPPAISQYIFQIFNINEKLNNMSWNRRNIENQTRLHKFFDPIMVNLPLTYRIFLTYHPKKKYRYILKSGLNFLSTCSFTIYFSDFQSLMKRKTK